MERQSERDGLGMHEERERERKREGGYLRVLTKETA